MALARASSRVLDGIPAVRQSVYRDVRMPCCSSRIRDLFYGFGISVVTAEKQVVNGLALSTAGAAARLVNVCFAARDAGYNIAYGEYRT